MACLVEVQLDELAKSGRVVVSQRLGVAKSLKYAGAGDEFRRERLGKVGGHRGRSREIARRMVRRAHQKSWRPQSHGVVAGVARANANARGRLGRRRRA